MGLLVPCGDPRAVGQAILDVLDQPQKYERSPRQIVDALHLEQTISRYEEVFHSASQ
jgi:hypothetical protein